MYKNSRHLLILLILFFLPFTVFSESGKIAVLDVQAALIGTEASKKAFEELSNSKDWKEVAEELQLKLNEANEIQENVQKEGPTMSDEDKVDAQKRLRSLSQDANFLNEKLNQMKDAYPELMRAKGIKIVLHSNAVLGLDDGDDSLNITPDIIELLNQDSES